MTTRRTLVLTRRALALSSLLLALAGALWWSRGAPRSFHVHGFGPPTRDAEPGPPRVAPEKAAGAAFVPFAEGLEQPVGVVAAPGEPGVLYVVEKVGRVVRLRGRERAVVADLSARVSTDSEQGLLGLAFHPKYAENGRVFVNLTNTRGDTEVLELHRAAGGAFDTASPKLVLGVKQPYANHNGGHLVFGPDGLLWIGLGDGGSGGDPHRNGQNPTVLLGKMLRLDVDQGGPPVIQMLGLRNPWRYSFDRETNDLWIGDVGQDLWEEVDAVRAQDALDGGQNFGWNVMEGAHCFGTRSCDSSAFVAPVVTYGRGSGCSVIGGVVYRGSALPALRGHYLYSDFCTGVLRTVRVEWPDGGAAPRVLEELDWKQALDPKGRIRAVTSFGEDFDGELYVASLEGTVFKLARVRSE